MKNLLYKELKLFTNPMNFLFLPLMAMIMIPSYPYYVGFFYILLGLFFSFQFGRENKDLVYMITLPIPKKDVVKAKYMFTVLLEAFAFLLGTILVIIRCTVAKYPNQAGIDANVAFLGLSLVMLALFNLVFLGGYFKNVYKVGGAFLKGCIAVFSFIVVAEASVHVLAGMTGSCFYDSTLPQDMLLQIPILAGGLLFYVLSVVLGYRRDVKRFAAQDL